MSALFDVLPRVTPLFTERRSRRTAEDNPVRVLMEETDPHLRSRAHLELGLRASARQDLQTALEHFQEAAELDPTDERPRSMLRNLGTPGDRPARLGLLGRLRAWRRRS